MLSSPRLALPRTGALLALALLGLATTPRPVAAAAPRYVITDLGAAPPTYPAGTAQAVNSFGFAAGYVSSPANNTARAFFYDLSLHDLGTLKADHSGNAFSLGLNDTGFVVGQADTDAGVPHPFLYAGGMSDLTPGAGPGAANAISRGSQVTGLTTNTGGVLQAFLYDSPSNTMTLLGLAGSKSEGLGVTDDGKVAGYTTDSSGSEAAFVSDSYGQSLTGLATLGGTRSQAAGVNVSDQVAGSADVASGALHAFRTSGGLAVTLTAGDDLGVLAGGVNSRAFSLNVAGQVVGYSEIAHAVHHAFVYDPNTSSRMQDLNALLPAGAGWVLTQANAINDTGTIVGFGTYKGAVHAFRLTPNPLAALGLSPNQIYGTLATTGTVLLRNPAPGTSDTVSLTSSSPLVTVPATVTVGQGLPDVLFTVNAVSVTKSTAVTITATYKGGVATTVLTILPTVPSSVSFAPALTHSGGSVVGTVTLTGPAPAGGTTVAMTSSTALLGVPATLTIPSGATEALFTATAASAVSATTIGTVTAKLGAVSAAATVKVTPISLTSFTLAPSLVNGGQGTTATVTLSDPAPAGGLVIPLATTDSTVTIPASLTIPAGGTEGSVPVAAPTTNVEKSVQLTATYNGPVGAFLDVKPSVVTTTNPSTMYADPALLGSGGMSSLGTFTVNFAPHGNVNGGGTTVTLTSSDPTLASVPASVYLFGDGSYGGTPGPTRTFPITTGGYVSQATPVTITATWSDAGGSGSASTTITLLPTVPAAIAVGPGVVSGGGQNSVGTVTVGGAPGGNVNGGGIHVALTSSNPALASVPADVYFFGDGSYGGTPGPAQTFAITTGYVAVPTTVTLTASVGSGAGAVTTSTTIGLLPAVPATITVGPGTISGGGQGSVGTVTLASAPGGNVNGGGVHVSLTSSNPAAASIPADVYLFGDGSYGGTPGPAQTFPITTGYVAALTKVTFTAKIGTVSKSTTITLLPFGPVTVNASTQALLGGTQGSVGTVTLASALGGNVNGGGVHVTLTSSNPAAASVPADVYLFSDGSYGGTPGPAQTFPITTGYVLQPTPVTFTATAGIGKVKTVSTATVTVLPNVPARLMLASAGVTSGQATTGTLTLVAAPAGNVNGGGLHVTLTSSNPAAASVPGDVYFFGDGSYGGTPGPTLTFPVSAGAVTAPTTVTITATLGSGTKAVHTTSQTLTVSPQ